jgi:hypothetical protein
LSYRVMVTVTDSTGLKLFQQDWQNRARADLRRPDVFAVDMVRFSVGPGRYRLAVAVQDSVSGRQADTGVDLEGFAGTPAASDLLLSPQIRPANTEDSCPVRPSCGGEDAGDRSRALDLTPLLPRRTICSRPTPPRPGRYPAASSRRLGRQGDDHDGRERGARRRRWGAWDSLISAGCRPGNTT